MTVIQLRAKDLRLDAFADDKYRDNWELLQEALDTLFNIDNPFINFQGQLFEVIETGTTAFQVAHNFGYVPTDIIITGNTGNATVTQGVFKDDSITLTTSVSTDLRLLLGRFIT